MLSPERSTNESSVPPQFRLPPSGRYFTPCVAGSRTGKAGSSSTQYELVQRGSARSPARLPGSFAGRGRMWKRSPGDVPTGFCNACRKVIAYLDPCRRGMQHRSLWPLPTRRSYDDHWTLGAKTEVGGRRNP